MDSEQHVGENESFWEERMGTGVLRIRLNLSTVLNLYVNVQGVSGAPNKTQYDKTRVCCLLSNIMVQWVAKFNEN